MSHESHLYLDTFYLYGGWLKELFSHIVCYYNYEFSLVMEENI